ncbi:MAG: hypothetical protein IJK18_09255 [Clostridia bacterium]|nr:hypothetical protein [Clostridia bacterium]
MSKKTIIVVSLIVLLLIIAVVFILKGDQKDRVKNMYNKIQNSQNFTFSMEENTSDINYKVSMAQRGKDVSIDMYSNEEHTTTLVLENESYYIMHNDKEYYDFGEEKVDSDIIISSLKNIVKDDYISGKEEIFGTTYYYEEFNNENMDFIIYANVNESSTAKTRFYFKENNICYIKNIINSEDENQEELIKTNLVYKVDNNQFEIPEDYAEAAE